MTRKKLKNKCSNVKVKADPEFNSLPNACHDIEQVTIYFSQKGLSEKEAQIFYSEFQDKHGRITNIIPPKRWKQEARLWIVDFLKSYPWLFDRNIH